MSTTTKIDITTVLPLKLPTDKHACPICGHPVWLTGVQLWEEDGTIVETEYGCSMMPDFESERWDDWFRWHHFMPYVDWLPWKVSMTEWLNERYYKPWEEAK